MNEDGFYLTQIAVHSEPAVLEGLDIAYCLLLGLAYGLRSLGKANSLFCWCRL